MRTTRLLAAVAALLLALGAGRGLAQPQQKVGEFGVSVFLAGPWDWAPLDNGDNRCFEMVDRAAAYNIRTVSFVVTFFWFDSGPAPLPPRWNERAAGGASDEQGLGAWYTYSRFNATTIQHWCYTRTANGCPEVTDAEIEATMGHLTACMRRAAGHDLNLAVNARVDDGRGLGGWRNTLKFDPSVVAGRYSYATAVLFPLADAVGAAVSGLPSIEVDFTLQGEMGATIFSFPRRWPAVADAVRDRVARAAAWPAPPEAARNAVRVGVGLNNLKIAGSTAIGVIDGDAYLAALATELDPSAIDFEGLRLMFGAMDHVSLSAYAPMRGVDFGPCDFEALLLRLNTELSYYGLSLAEITGELGAALIFGEFGIGGGVRQDGSQPARTPEEALYYPFFGVTEGFKCSTDPWSSCAPGAPSPVREIRRRYFEQASAYLRRGGCAFPAPDKVFLWSLGSWDVLDIYPASGSAEGSYKDAKVVDIIERHNAAVFAASDGAAGGAVTPK